MKIIITGGSGLLGQYLNVHLSKGNDILTLYNLHKGNCNSFNSYKIDLRQSDELKKVFYQFKPDVVVHSAAITSALLDDRYSLSQYYQNNVVVTENIAKLSSQLKSKLIYISSDLVYDGNRGSFLKENSKLNPLSPYAESKLIGEEKVKEFSENFNILRLALLIGFGLNHSICHFQQTFESLKSKKTVKLFVDQYRSPISLSIAAVTIKQIIEFNLPSGVYNLGGAERISRFNLFELIADRFDFDKNLLIPMKLDDLKQVPKVKDVSLDLSKLNSYGIEIYSIEKIISQIF